MTSQDLNARGKAEAVLSELLSGLTGPVLVHSDVFRTRGAIRGVTGRQALLSAHTSLQLEAASGRSIWMPAFNYDFLRTGSFAVHQDASQVGALTEHFRTEHALWRTSVPVFSVSGTGHMPAVNLGPRIDPFGSDSIFARLDEQNGSILFYGAGIESCTFIHYAERVAGGPVYRYDKAFFGDVAGLAFGRAELIYHVRPLGHHLDYDWARLDRELVEQGLLERSVSQRFTVASIDAAALRSFWCERIAADPLYLLDEESRVWVETRLDELGRRFLLADFETGEFGEES